MQISKSIELDTGSVKFEGTLEGAELDIVLQTGLLVLLRQGVISASLKDQDDDEEGAVH